jgi:hypothetical protein
MTKQPKDPTMKTKPDAWLDEVIERMAYCIGESKEERRDDVSQIFDEMKQAILERIERIKVEAELELLRKISDSDVSLNHGTIELLGWFKQDLNKKKQTLKKGR